MNRTKTTTRGNRPTPWRELVRLRPELRTGELTLAQFAADLHEVAQAEGKRPIYEDPAKFFALTFPTHALRELVKEVARRLAGESDKAVRQLELTYGGGKTHTLVALHHLFRDPEALPDIPAVREFRESVGGALPRASPAVLCFDKLDVERGIEDVRGPGGERRTLRHPWSVLAFQLAGDDGLRAIHAEGKAEERETPPAEPLLAKLIARPQEQGLATLILVDEVLMYAREKAGMNEVWRHRIQDFFQYLVQAVARVDRAALVASLLATDPAKQADAAGKQLVKDLSNVFRRQKEEGIQPVGKEDVAEVLRRRFFEPEELTNREEYRAEVIAAVRGLGELDGQIRKAARAEEERFLASYPFHPDLTEVFYSRWTQLEGFQRTRGILRTLAIALREAGQWDDCPLIGPAALLGRPGRQGPSEALSDLATTATAEETLGKRTEWKQLLEGELERARRVQEELPSLGRRREVEQAVVGVFLHSQPLGQKAHTPELLRLIGSGGPDRIELERGLRRWRDISWFLDDEDDAAGTAAPASAAAGTAAGLPKSWRLGNRPNLRQMHDEAVKQRVSAAAVEKRLEEAIRKAKKLTEGAAAAGAVVHLLPARPADLPDDDRFRFAVLSPAAKSESGRPSALARRFLDETTGPDRPRVHRNTVVLAVPSREGIDAAESAAQSLLGWEDVEAQLDQLDQQRHPVDPARRLRLRGLLKEARARLPEAVRQAYAVVVTTDREDQIRAFRLPADGGPLFQQIRADERARLQETALAPAALLPDGPYELWKPGESARRVSELANTFARHPRLPKLLRPELVRETVLRGVEEGLLAARLARPDGSARTLWRERVDPEAAKSPDLEAVLPERAKLSRLPEALLEPGRLPGLWPDGGGLPFAGLTDYFSGGRQVSVPREGFEDFLTIPACDTEALRAAAARAVEQGIVWLTNGPASLWQEPVPDGVFEGRIAVFHRPPEKIPPQELTEDLLPEAWTDGGTNGIALNQTLSQKRRAVLPWGLVRASIRAAVNARWLEIEAGAVDCPFDQAGQLRLRAPAPRAVSTPDGSPLPDAVHPPPRRAAVLEIHQLQDLADRAPELAALSAGYDLRFRIALEMDEEAGAETRRKLNERLAGISPDLKV